MELSTKHILYLSLLSAGFAKSTAKEQLRVLFTPLFKDPAIISFTPEVPKKHSPVLPIIAPSIQLGIVCFFYLRSVAPCQSSLTHKTRGNEKAPTFQKGYCNQMRHRLTGERFPFPLTRLDNHVLFVWGPNGIRFHSSTAAWHQGCSSTWLISYRLATSRSSMHRMRSILSSLRI